MLTHLSDPARADYTSVISPGSDRPGPMEHQASQARMLRTDRSEKRPRQSAGALLFLGTGALADSTTGRGLSLGALRRRYDEGGEPVTADGATRCQ